MTNASNPVLQQIQKDFRSYWISAEKSRLEDPQNQRSIVWTANQFARGFLFLSRAMGDGEQHSRIFLKELTSDTVHLVHALVGGDARGARFYLRSVIENFWRHHYFRDHPVEYGWLHTRAKYFIEMKNLREHCGWLDCFAGKIKPLLGDLNRLYGELSTSVHSTSSRTLVLREALDEIRLSTPQGQAVVNDVRSVLRSCLGLCIYSERLTYNGMHVNVQTYLKSLLTASQRNRLEDDLRDAELLEEQELLREAPLVVAEGLEGNVEP